MHKKGIFSVLALAVMLFSGVAQANPNTWLWYFEDDLNKPLLSGPKEPQYYPGNKEKWSPEDWVSYHNGDEYATYRALERAGIVTGQSFRGDVPVLEVGQAFVRLSSGDQKKVLRYVDHIFNITQKHPSHVIYVYHDESDDYIGIYNKNGLQLQ